MADPVDYSALAAQVRSGTPAPAGQADYSALAAQVRGASSAPQTEDDLIRSYGFDPAVIKKAHMYSPDTFTKMMANPTEGMIIGQPGLVSDLVHGIMKAPLAAVTLTSHGLAKFTGNPADDQFAQLLLQVSNDAYRKYRGGEPNKIADMLGQIVSVPVPGGAAKTIPGMIGRGALAGTIGAAAQPTEAKEPGDDFWLSKLRQTLTGAVVGGATAGVLGGVGKLANRVSASKSVELPEEIAGRAQAGGGAALTDLETKMQQTPFAGAADVGRAAAAGDRAAQNLETQMIAAKTPGQVLQASIGLQDWRTSQKATELYDAVEKAVKKYPKLGDVPLPKTEALLKAALDRVNQAKYPDEALKEVLTTGLDRIGAGESDELVSNSYPLIREMRSDLGGIIKDLRTGTGKVLGTKASGVVQQVQNAVEDDLRDFARNSGIPEVQKAADAADSYFARYRVPFKAMDVAKAGTPNAAGSGTAVEPDQIYQAFIKAGRGDKAQRFFDALDPRGRAAVQYQMASEALNDATNNLDGTFDPKKFFNALDNIKEAHGVFFQGPDKAVMDGLKKLAQQAVLAKGKEEALKGTLNKMATGGAIATEVASRTGMPGIVTGGAGVLSTLALAARGLMLTDRGRRLLADASTMAPGNPQLTQILNQLLQTAPVVAARAATQQ